MTVRDLHSLTAIGGNDDAQACAGGEGACEWSPGRLPGQGWLSSVLYWVIVFITPDDHTCQIPLGLCMRRGYSTDQADSTVSKNISAKLQYSRAINGNVTTTISAFMTYIPVWTLCRGMSH